MSTIYNAAEMRKIVLTKEKPSKAVYKQDKFWWFIQTQYKGWYDSEGTMINKDTMPERCKISGDSLIIKSKVEILWKRGYYDIIYFTNESEALDFSRRLMESNPNLVIN